MLYHQYYPNSIKEFTIMTNIPLQKKPKENPFEDLMLLMSLASELGKKEQEIKKLKAQENKRDQIKNSSIIKLCFWLYLILLIFTASDLIYSLYVIIFEDYRSLIFIIYNLFPYSMTCVTFLI